MTWEMAKKYFLLDLDEYFDGISFPINLFILSISVGVCIAIFFITAHNIYTYNILRQLIRHNAMNTESAKTLNELHVKPSFMLRSALSRHGQLTMMVKMACEQESEEKTKKHKIDFSIAKFYLSAENIDRAKRISEGTRPTYIHAALFSLFVLSLSVFLSLFMPEILAFLSGM